MKQPGGLAVIIGAGKPPAGDDSAGAGPQGTGDGGMGGDGGNDDSSEDCVPLSSLAMPDPDSGDQMTPPAVGDNVQYNVEGKVTRIEGENAYVQRVAVNGHPVEANAEGGMQNDEGYGADADAQEGSDIRDQAQQMGGY